jgi:hypothetical protein
MPQYDVQEALTHYSLFSNQERINKRLTYLDNDTKLGAYRREQASTQEYLEKMISKLERYLEHLSETLPDPQTKIRSTSNNPHRTGETIFKILQSYEKNFQDTIQKLNEYYGEERTDPYLIKETLALVKIFKKSVSGRLQHFKSITDRHPGHKLHGFDFETIKQALEPFVKIASSLSLYKPDPEEQKQQEAKKSCAFK